MIEDLLTERGNLYKQEKYKIDTLKKNRHNVVMMKDITEVIEPFLNDFKTLLDKNGVALTNIGNTFYLKRKNEDWHRITLLETDPFVKIFPINYTSSPEIIQAYIDLTSSVAWGGFIHTLQKIHTSNARYDFILSTMDRKPIPFIQENYELIEEYARRFASSINPVQDIRVRDDMSFLRYDDEWVSKIEWINNGKMRGTLYLTLHNQTIDGQPVVIERPRKMKSTIVKLIEEYLRNIYWYYSGI